AYCPRLAFSSFPTRRSSDLSFGSLIAPFGVAMVAALWAYDGWIEITYVGGEVKDPERNLPRSIVLSTLIGIALYCLVTASFTYVDRKSTRLNSSHGSISYAV